MNKVSNSLLEYFDHLCQSNSIFKNQITTHNRAGIFNQLLLKSPMNINLQLPLINEINTI